MLTQSVSKNVTPSPNHYNVDKETYDRLSGSKSPLYFDLKPRHPKFFLDPTQEQINAPAPNLYNISELLTKPSRFLNDYMDFNRSHYTPNKQ